ncbi:MAG: DUF3810 family protein, partial [Vulcanimicrobiaceae bacterium]
ARIPLAQKIPIDERRVTPQALDALATRAAAALDSLAPGAHAESPALGPLQRRLVPSFEAVIARLGDRARFAPPRVKPTIFALFFGLSGTSGFTDPWTHEINLDPGATAVERPALYAHEWGHLSGFADETEANYISVLACTRSHDPLLEYSGWLLVWFNLPQSAHPARALSPLADADVGEIVRRYLARRNPLIERIQRLAYGAYLQRNGVATGYASYSLFVRWLLGARYDRGGLPLTARLNE